jgi:hypothetical protein
VRERIINLRSANAAWAVNALRPGTDGLNNAQYLRQNYEMFCRCLLDKRINAANKHALCKICTQLHTILARAPVGADDGGPLPPLPAFERELLGKLQIACGYWERGMPHGCKTNGLEGCVFMGELIAVDRDDKRGRCGRHCIGSCEEHAKLRAAKEAQKRTADQRSPAKPPPTIEELQNGGAAGGAAHAVPLKKSKRALPFLGVPQLLPAAAGDRGAMDAVAEGAPLAGQPPAAPSPQAPLPTLSPQAPPLSSPAT